MQTNLAEFVRDTPEGKEAEAILRKCVHCGFCTATCPTYQLLGDELDGPRGRIYLMKQVLEGAPVTAKTQLHLDRCLTCRACETTCPSGVQYGRLLDIGRGIVESRVTRPLADRLKRKALAAVVPVPKRFEPLLRLGRRVRPLLPASLKAKVPQVAPAAGVWPAPRHARRMLVLAGCAQSSIAPDINAAAARVLDRIGISLVQAADAGCCGAVRFHLNDHEAGRADMRAVIDAWWPAIERGEVEAIVMTASGCGAMVKEYGHVLARDRHYADRSRRVADLTCDLSQVIDAEMAKVRPLVRTGAARRLAFHAPCTLQHGQQVKGVVERILAACGATLTAVPDGHLCCGSAGTYALLQPELSKALLENKVAALQSGGPEAIATANIGCLTHLQGGSTVPVRHWIEIVDQLLGPSPD